MAGISVSDLPPKYQEQVAKQVVAEQRRRNKYNNCPADRGGIRFDSQKEARRFDQLILLERAGQITDLRMQVDFTLQEAYTDTEGRRVRAIRYKADFTYRRNGQLVVEDVKSSATKTKTYAIKRKLMAERYGINIVEV